MAQSFRQRLRKRHDPADGLGIKKHNSETHAKITQRNTVEMRSEIMLTNPFSGGTTLLNHELNQTVFVLRHIESDEFICLRQGGREHLACFSDGDSALQFRQELGLLEHVDIASQKLGDTPFDQFWLNGEMASRAVATQTVGAK